MKIEQLHSPLGQSSIANIEAGDLYEKYVGRSGVNSIFKKSNGAAKWLLKRIASKLGLTEFDFASHSTRTGSAVEQIEHGIELAQIMQSGR